MERFPLRFENLGLSDGDDDDNDDDDARLQLRHVKI